MDKLWQKIIDHKANPVWWPFLPGLLIVSLLYRLGLFFKNRLSPNPVKLKKPVISVGNITVGGTGKTPVTVFIASHFLSSGKKVGIVCSGYGRKNRIDILGRGDDIIQKDIDDTGDELMEMAQLLPEAFFSVASSKTEAAVKLEDKFRPDLIILDDGYQHRRLHRDLNILLLDSTVDLQKESIFPLGRLREGLKAIKRADLILLTKTNYSDSKFNPKNLPGKLIEEKPTYRIRFTNESIVSEIDEIPFEEIAKKKYYFFAGIGNYTNLLNQLKTKLPDINGERQFADHCRYGQNDLAAIKNDLDNFDPEIIITTYKDYNKVRTFDFGRPLYYLKLKLLMENGEQEFFNSLEFLIK